MMKLTNGSLAKVLLLLAEVASAGGINAQTSKPFEREMDIKTNLVTDALGNVSLGAEFSLDCGMSFCVDGTYNGWNVLPGKEWKNWSISPELRFYGNNELKGSFFGFHFTGGEFNVNGLKLPIQLYGGDVDSRYSGQFFGVGVGYGYRCNLSKHFAVEGELGVGWLNVAYTKSKKNYGFLKETHNVALCFAPTRAAINLIYRIGL